MTGLVLWLALAASPAAAPVSADPVDALVEKTLAGMGLEQKIGQLMMIGFGGREMGPEIKRLLLGLHPGAVAIYSRNVRSPNQIHRLIQDIDRVLGAEVAPFVAIDQEGGNVVRVRFDVAVLPGTMTLGATRDPVLAFLAGQAQAVDLRLIGLNMNLAPVLDINHNPRNPVINVRAFGDDPKSVSELGAAFVRGQQSAQMATVAKHFPGHGTTDRDSHFDLPRITLTADQLLDSELRPFQRAIEAGLDAVMTAHVQVPSVDPDGTPASLSYKVITGLLRERLGFDGLVITDDLEMRAVSGTRGVGPAAVQSILAGSDMVMVIWTPHRKQEVFDALLQAARDGTLTAERLDASLRRILRLKARHGILTAARHRPANALAYLPNAYHQQVAKTIAVRGLTLIENRHSVVPLCSGPDVLVASPYPQFREALTRMLPGSMAVTLRQVPSRKNRQQELDRLVALAPRYRTLVVGVANVYQAWLVQQLMHKTDRPVVVVNFGSPYLIRHFPQVAAYLCTYSYLPSAQRAAAEALTGHQSITGRLPVSLSRDTRGAPV